MKDFCQALLDHVSHSLARMNGDAEYSQEAVRIIDARNYLFGTLESAHTDEENGIYAIRDLCILDDMTMLFHPDLHKIQAVARNYF